MPMSPFISPQPVVVAGDEHRAAGVPAFGGADQARLVQPAGDAPVEALDAHGPRRRGAQQLELAVGGEHLRAQASMPA